MGQIDAAKDVQLSQRQPQSVAGRFRVNDSGWMMTVNPFGSCASRSATALWPTVLMTQPLIPLMWLLHHLNRFRQLIAEGIRRNFHRVLKMTDFVLIMGEKASAWMKHSGFNKVWHIEGGIIEYARRAREQGLPVRSIQASLQQPANFSAQAGH
jgi:hypothetical protein